MPISGELIVKNHEGNELEGPRENKSCLVFEFEHTVYLPFDPEQNKIQGARRISEFMIVKDIDRLTPQLYDIVCNGRQCKEVLIKLYRIAAETGEEEEYFNYLLEEAKIVSVENFMPSTKHAATENIGHLERVKFLAKKFTWKYLDGGIEYSEKSF